ncbi:MAG: hypothetical protein ACOX6M_13150 [Armatimonadota bacterium]
MHYCNMSDEEILETSKPKIDALLRQVNSQVMFQIKLAGGEIKEDKIATEDDIAFLESLYGPKTSNIGS